jgi:hypothetical protein
MDEKTSVAARNGDSTRSLMPRLMSSSASSASDVASGASLRNELSRWRLTTSTSLRTHLSEAPSRKNRSDDSSRNTNSSGFSAAFLDFLARAVSALTLAAIQASNAADSLSVTATKPPSSVRNRHVDEPSSNSQSP